MQVFIWKTFRGLLFSDFLMRTMPSFVKQAWTNPLCFNFLPLKAMFSFINVMFIFTEAMFFFIYVLQFSSVQQGFLTMFPAQKIHYCFFDLLLSGFHILWHASTSLGELTSMSESTEITVSSKSLSETCAGIPATSILFLLSCWSNTLTEESLDMTSFTSSLHFSCNFLFSSCSLLITMFWRFIISSLRQFIVEMFSSTLAYALLLTTSSFLVRVLHLWVITSVISEQADRCNKKCKPSDQSVKQCETIFNNNYWQHHDTSVYYHKTILHFHSL